MATSVILVDNTDVSRITYDPPSAWTKGGSAQEHNSTTAALTGSGTVTFTFNGTDVLAYGTIPANTKWTGVQCNVDGVDYLGPPTATSADTLYNFQYCNSPNLQLSGDKEHTLTIKPSPSISNTSNSGYPYFYLDYILYNYTQGSSANAVPPGALASVIVDDSQTDRIKFDGPAGPQSWVLAGADGEYAKTTHGTSTGGATATIEFNGTRVEVYGTIGQGSPGSSFTSSYTIDGGTTVNYGSSVLPNNAVQRQMRFFQSNVLQDGKHTLVIMSTTQASLGYWLDYVVYTTSELNPSKADSTPFSPPASDPHGKKTNIGLIAGVTVAAVLVIIVGVVGTLFILRRRRKSEGRYDAPDKVGPALGSPTTQPSVAYNPNSGNSGYTVTPYTSNPAFSDTRTSTFGGPAISILSHNNVNDNRQSFPPSPPSLSPSSPAFSSSTSARDRTTSGAWTEFSSSTGGGFGSGSQAQAQAQTAGQVLGGGTTSKGVTMLTPDSGRTRPVVQHHDGGVRLRSESPELEPEELPPVYQDHFRP